METVIPVGMCVKRTADSVLLTCCRRHSMSDVHVVKSKFKAYLTTSAPRTHHLNPHFVHREEVVLLWLSAIL